MVLPGPSAGVSAHEYREREAQGLPGNRTATTTSPLASDNLALMLQVGTHPHPPCLPSCLHHLGLLGRKAT